MNILNLFHAEPFSIRNGNNKLFTHDLGVVVPGEDELVEAGVCLGQHVQVVSLGSYLERHFLDAADGDPVTPGCEQ